MFPLPQPAQVSDSRSMTRGVLLREGLNPRVAEALPSGLPPRCLAQVPEVTRPV